MSTDKTIRKWSTLQGLQVAIYGQGKNAGTVEDFYFQPGTNAIYALSVRTRLAGVKALPANSIKEITSDAVVVTSEKMLTTRIPAFPLGSSLLNATVKNEDEKETGTITELLIAIAPIVALRIAGYEVVDSHGKHAKQHKSLAADAVMHYGENTLIVDKQTASKLY